MHLYQSVLIVIASLGLFSSWVFRIRLFMKYSDDPVIERLTMGTYPTTFLDLLAFSLLRERARIPAHARRTVNGFLVSNFGAGALILAALIPTLVRDYLFPLFQ